jgi:hypothetical protein
MRSSSHRRKNVLSNTTILPTAMKATTTADQVDIENDRTSRAHLGEQARPIDHGMILTQSCERPSSSGKSLFGTPNSSGMISLINPTSPPSLLPYGSMSSGMKSSILTKSSPTVSSPVSLPTQSNVSVTSKLHSTKLRTKPLKPSSLKPIGGRLGNFTETQSFSRTLTDVQNSRRMGASSQATSGDYTQPDTTAFSNLIASSVEKRLPLPASSLILKDGMSMFSPSLIPAAWMSSNLPPLLPLLADQIHLEKRKSADVGTKALTAIVPPVAIAMPVSFAEAESIEPKTVNLFKRPKWTRGFLWTCDEVSTTPSASFSEIAPLLPSIPENELTKRSALDTIAAHPHLFKIVTPIRYNRLSALLRSHPNRPLVDCVVDGFHQGFYPGFDTTGHNVPDTIDNSSIYAPHDPSSPEAAFLRAQRDEEIRLGRYSESFGTELLPGMIAQPIHAVPKPHSSKLRLINDHSAGDWALNSFIAKEIGHIRMDSVQDLGKTLLHARRELGPDATIWLWKSDVSQAFCQLPMHPLWQMKQISTFDGHRHVDRCAVFGN